MALLWLVFKWPPQHRLSTCLPGQRAMVGRRWVETDSSVEALIRNRGFPVALSNAFGQT